MSLVKGEQEPYLILGASLCSAGWAWVEQMGCQERAGPEASSGCSWVPTSPSLLSGLTQNPP